MENTLSKECIKTLPEKSREHNHEKPPHLIPLTRWNDHHAWPPIGGLRHLAFNAKARKCEDVFLRVGRRVLVDEQKFYDFIARENRNAG